VLVVLARVLSVSWCPVRSRARRTPDYTKVMVEQDNTRGHCLATVAENPRYSVRHACRGRSRVEATGRRCQGVSRPAAPSRSVELGLLWPRGPLRRTRLGRGPSGGGAVPDPGLGLGRPNGSGRRLP